MIRLLAPAKVNLYLHVLGRRADGFHELETVFERIDLFDELTFEPAPTLSLTCDEPTLSCGEDNLILKAAHLLQRAAAAREGARIHLRKRIPIAAGLGGGSSDAAATLRGLSALWRLDLPEATLTALAARLGSDVAFFLSSGPFAIGRGRGEVCEPVAAGISLTHLLVSPPQRLSTKEVFDAYKPLTASRPSSTIIRHALRNGSLSELAKGLWNDLAPEAIRRCPVIARIQASLGAQHCLGVLMSGSGSAVFGLCQDEAHAQALATTLRPAVPSAWHVEVVCTDTVGE